MGQHEGRSAERAGQEVRVHMEDPRGPDAVAQALVRLGADLRPAGPGRVVLICVGTDRSIGDSLGPLVGTLLTDQGEWPFQIWGTLDEPVHAGNLKEVVSRLEHSRPAPLVVALDACLGRSESVGYVTVGRGALRPGAGVNKNLPAIGQIHITGVVNVGGFMEYLVLQNTRLSLVMRMARMVAAGVGRGLTRLAQNRPGALTLE